MAEIGPKPVAAGLRIQSAAAVGITADTVYRPFTEAFDGDIFTGCAGKAIRCWDGAAAASVSAANLKFVAELFADGLAVYLAEGLREISNLTIIIHCNAHSFLEFCRVPEPIWGLI